MAEKVLLPVKISTPEFLTSEIVVSVCDTCFTLVPEGLMAQYKDGMHA